MDPNSDGPREVGGVEYRDASGNAIALTQMDDFRLVLADIGDRLRRLEAGGATQAEAATPDGRFARLEAVVAPYFRDQLEQYDAERAAADKPV